MDQNAMDSEARWQPDWKLMDGNRFQDLCLDLLSCEGYELQDQGIGPDGGVDAILVQTFGLPDDTAKHIRWAAQFKFKMSPDATVKPRELGNVENILGRFQAEGFFLVTNGRVTNKALLELRGVLTRRHPGYFVSVWTRRHLEQRLASNREVACRYFQVPLATSRPIATFEITIDLPIEDFSGRQQRLLQHALASFLEIPVVAVTIREISKGSTKVRIELPEKTARLFREALKGNYLPLDAFGFKPAILSVKELHSATAKESMTTTTISSKLSTPASIKSLIESPELDHEHSSSGEPGTLLGHPCEYCGDVIPLGFERCPHCGRPGLFPNVLIASSAEQQSALQARYLAATNLAASLGQEELLRRFEAAVCEARAVVPTSYRSVDRLTAGGDLAASYYNITEIQQLAMSDRWDRLRRLADTALADTALFPDQAIASTASLGMLVLGTPNLSSFGECSLVLRDEKIAHRATVFEEDLAPLANTLLNREMPIGHRAIWRDRGKLCVAMFGPRLVREQPSVDEFRALLEPEESRADGYKFVGVNIWGPLSIRSVERITIRAVGKRVGAWTRALVPRLAPYDVSLEVLQ